MLTEDYREQPSLESLADASAVADAAPEVFTLGRLSPKAFLQAVPSIMQALLRQETCPCSTSIEVGLSGPSRLHDLFVTHEAIVAGEWKARGAGLTIRYGFHPSPSAAALVMVTDRGLAGLAFADSGEERASFEDMPPGGRTRLCRGQRGDGAAMRDAFSTPTAGGGRAAPIFLIGSISRSAYGRPCADSAARPRPIPGSPKTSASDGLAWRRRRGRGQPDLLRRPLPPCARQDRRSHRLSLGPDAQARDPRLEAGKA